MTNDEQSRRVELLRNHGRISGDDDIRGNALGHDGASGNDGVFADGHAFEDDGVHADPDVIGDDDGSGAQRRAGRAVLEKRRESVSVDDALGGRERMEIGVGDADVPRDEAMRPYLDPFFGHDEGAIHQGEIADRATAVHADGEGTASITGNVIAENYGVRRFAFQVAKDLGALAIEAFAEDDIGRDRFLPPIVFNAPLAIDVAHDG